MAALVGNIDREIINSLPLIGRRLKIKILDMIAEEQERPHDPEPLKSPAPSIRASGQCKVLLFQRPATT